MHDLDKFPDAKELIAFRMRVLLLLALILVGYGSLLAQVADNDTRATAFELTVGAAEICTPLRGNTAEGSPSLSEPSCATPDPIGGRRDLWYYFVASAERVTLSVDAYAGSVGSMFVSVTDEAGDELRCELANTWSVRRLRFDSLEVGDTITIQLAAFDARSYTAFDVCAFETPVCLAPQNLQLITGQNWAQLSFVNGDGSPALAGGRFYRALAGIAPFNPVLNNPDTTAISGRSPITIWGLQPGEFYRTYVQEICSDSDESTYVLPNQNFRQKPAGTPPNDSLGSSQAQILGSVFSDCRPSPGTTRNATSESLAPAGCAGDADDDVWYRIRPQGPQYRFILSPAPGISADLALEILDSNLDVVTCSNDATGGESEVVDLYDLRPDDTYYVRVYTVASNEVADFEVCAFRFDRPIASDTGCTNAITVTLDGTGDAGEFVDVINAEGELLVSIENTQDLGRVDVSYYGANDSVRVLTTDTVPTYYARNNITIDPERQPSDSVTVRFYLSASDLLGLASIGAVQGLSPSIEVIPTHTNTSGGSSSGSGGGRTIRGVLFIPGEVDVSVTRVPTARCSGTYLEDGFLTSVVGVGEHDDGMYIDVRVSGFSDFFFSAGSHPLSVEDSPSSVRYQAFAKTLNVYPNPTQGLVTIALPQVGSTRYSQYTLLDMTGRVVVRGTISSEHITINLAGLSSGTYQLMIVGEQHYVSRIVKQ